MIFYFVCGIIVINMAALVGLYYFSANRRMENHLTYMKELEGVWKA